MNKIKFLVIFQFNDLNLKNILFIYSALNIKLNYLKRNVSGFQASKINNYILFT